MRRRSAFTLIELLVVIGIIVLLASLLLPAMKSAWEQARQVACMSNLRQISAAYLSYAADNDSYLLPCDTQTKQAGAPADSNQALAIPELLPYSRDARVFHCPKDSRTGFRSYSINDYLGGTFPAPGFRHAAYLKDVRNAARTFLFIEETVPLDQQRATGGFVVLPNPSPIWVDAPAIVHGSGSCMSFVDGHCEHHVWTDPRTPHVQSNLPFYRTPDNRDLIELQRIDGQSTVPSL